MRTYLYEKNYLLRVKFTFSFVNFLHNRTLQGWGIRADLLFFVWVCPTCILVTLFTQKKAAAMCLAAAFYYELKLLFIFIPRFF